MHDDVRAGDQRVHRRAVEHVTLAILRALPAVLGGVERAPRHADDAAHFLAALERADDGAPDVAGRPRDRDSEALGCVACRHGVSVLNAGLTR